MRFDLVNSFPHIMSLYLIFAKRCSKQAMRAQLRLFLPVVLVPLSGTKVSASVLTRRSKHTQGSIKPLLLQQEDAACNISVKLLFFRASF